MLSNSELCNRVAAYLKYHDQIRPPAFFRTNPLTNSLAFAFQRTASPDRRRRFCRHRARYRLDRDVARLHRRRAGDRPCRRSPAFAARTAQASEQLIEKTKGMEATQQEWIDQLQVVQDQLLTVRRLLAAQQADTKKLSEQVGSLTESVDGLRQSFASAQASEPLRGSARRASGQPRQSPARTGRRTAAAPRRAADRSGRRFGDEARLSGLTRGRPKLHIDQYLACPAASQGPSLQVL